MEAIQDAFGGAKYDGRLRERAQEEQSFVEADQGGWIGNTRSVEPIQQSYDAGGFVVAEVVSIGFEFSELAVESGHSGVPTRVPHARFGRQWL